MTAMKINLNDGTLFGNDAAEDEDKSVLMSYFVDQPSFARFFDPTRRLEIATARKGMGKSALLVRCAELFRESKGGTPSLVVQRVPSQLVALKEAPPTDDHTVLENYWKQVICGAINMELAEQIGFAWNDNQLALVESAEIAGFSGRSLVGALLSRLVGKVNVGGVELTQTARPTANHEQLLRRLDSERSSRRAIWFLLDDIDAKYQSTPRQQAVISSFISACRNLVRDTQGVGIRATLRSDVWASLTSAEDMDKAEQYCTEIRWSASEQKQLLAQRILAYVKRTYPDSEIATRCDPDRNAGELIPLAFAARMKWGGTYVPAEHVVRVLSGGRPRWMAQLCRDAGGHAARLRKDVIGMNEINQAMPEFGRRRLADLYKEHQYQFAHLKELIECFSGGPRRFDTRELLDYIDAKYTRFIPTASQQMIDGVLYRDNLQLARMLYKCGFINGSNEKPNHGRPEFIGYDARPDLLKVATNLDDGMCWEIQPAYRNVLRID